MKLLLLFSFLFTLLLFSNENIIINQSELRCKRDRSIKTRFVRICSKKTDKEFFTGRAVKNNKEGLRVSEKNYRDGREISAVFWYDNGNKRYEKTSEKQIWWYKNGKKERLRLFKNGKWENKLTIWNENGKNKRIVNTVKPNQIPESFTGIAVKWGRDGYIIRIAEYKNSKLNGVWVNYSYKDVKFEERYYKNGKLNGSIKHWYTDINKIADITYYKNGKAEGISKSWYENGKPRDLQSYKNGKKHGKFIEWDRKGNKVKEENYKDGKLSL